MNKETKANQPEPADATGADDLITFADDTGTKLANDYNQRVEGAAGSIIAVIAPILIEVITSLIGACPKPPAPASLQQSANRPRLLHRVMLNSHLRRVMSLHPEVDLDVAAARETLLAYGSGATTDDAQKMVACARLVS